MHWIWIGILMGIGLMLAPFVLAAGPMLLMIFGLPALGAALGLLIAASSTAMHSWAC